MAEHSVAFNPDLSIDVYSLEQLRNFIKRLGSREESIYVDQVLQIFRKYLDERGVSSPHLMRKTLMEPECLQREKLLAYNFLKTWPH